MIKKAILLLASTFLLGFSVYAQRSDRALKARLNDYFSSYGRTHTMSADGSRLENVWINTAKKQVVLNTNRWFGTQSFTPDIIDNICKDLREYLPAQYKKYTIVLRIDGTPVEKLVPTAWSRKPDPDRVWHNIRYKGNPWVKPMSKPYSARNGLYEHHIALWASHGRFYKHSKDRWMWQRPKIFCTSEDLLTQTFVVPYLIPMLENAGAIVFTPRERSWQKHEVIVDNDTPQRAGKYVEKNGRNSWSLLKKGFAYTKDILYDGENPFLAGTSTMAHTTTHKNELSTVTWHPNIPEDGKYAVYVSYQTVPTSVSDALYTVRHKGITTEFKVNQQIGGGTWVYLGTFEFASNDDKQNCVTLSNLSNYRGAVTADAVRFGGGMGNIARGETRETASISGLPRYLEGSRYSAQWAGMPDSVYNLKESTNDYADDINTRSLMTNYLAGGSVYLPADSGLNVPLELSVALHSDAGYSFENKHIGTLAIYTTDFNDGKLASNLSRYTSRDLCDMVVTQVNNDLCQTFGSWNRRRLMDSNYSETRIPQIPSMILEMLSHQNFADLRLAYDPYFRFTFARAIYKGILRYIGTMHNKQCVIQPLPITDFAVMLNREAHVAHLTWTPVADPLEPDALPVGYVVYTRKGNGDFDNGIYCTTPSFNVPLEKGTMYSFRIAAINAGGESMPSEELCVLDAGNSTPAVLLVNGFQRIAGPQPIDNDSIQGFDLNIDPGVPYMASPALSGMQLNMYRQPNVKPDEEGPGHSGTELEGVLVAGNTFDFTCLHGRDILRNGNYSFASCSRSALEKGKVDSTPYAVIDLILGLQRNDGYSVLPYPVYTPELCQVLSRYTQQGGSLFVSGAYVTSDIRNEQERMFVANVFKCSDGGRTLSSAISGLRGMNVEFDIYRQLNEKRYAAPSFNIITPVQDAYCTILYLNDNQSASTAYAGNDYRCMVMGFPFESITNDTTRQQMMEGILKFLTTRH